MSLIFQSLELELNELRNRTTGEAALILGDNQTDIAKQLVDMIDDKILEINKKVENTSDDTRVRHILDTVRMDIKMELDEEGYEKSLAGIRSILSETQQQIKLIQSQSPEEEIIYILYETEEKVIDDMENNEIELNLLIKNVTDKNNTIQNFMVNAAEKIKALVTDAMDHCEMIIAKEDVTHLNHLFLNTTNVVEELNATCHHILESFKKSMEDILKTGNTSQISGHFQSLKNSVISIFHETMDKIIKTHPIWATLTVVIMFLPGLIVTPVFMGGICLKRIYYRSYELICMAICVILLAFCFPIGVLVTPLCQAMIVPTGADESVGVFEALTGLAIGFEAFFESAPQVVLQNFIIFKSGTASTMQLLSICLSMVMLLFIYFHKKQPINSAFIYR